MRARVLTLLMAAALMGPLGGCLANMSDLKERLGFTDPVPAATPEPPTPPTPIPPIARVQANVTLTVTGSPVRFTSEGSMDPDGAIIKFSWDFGDAERGEGRSVTHAFARAGEYPVKLTVRDDAGLTATDTVTVTVKQPNRPPVAILDVRDARGNPVTSSDVGTPLFFSANKSSDPDGDALSFDWDFGNGETAHTEKATVKYAKPGLYLVELSVRDAKSMLTKTTRLIAQNENKTWAGQQFPATEPAGARATFPATVPEGAASFKATLRFGAGFGTNELAFLVLDAADKEVAREAVPAEPGETGEKTRTIALTADVMRGYAAGEWKIVVEKVKGVQVDFSVSSTLQF